jgi:diaminopimelate epimerase
MLFFNKKKNSLQKEASRFKEIKMEKWHALGNDFLITSELNLSKETIIKLADRNFGIGCDQFIVFDGKNVCFFNSDGSESGMCGNALKCIVSKFVEEFPHKKEFTLNLKSGEVKIKIWENGKAQINIGKPVKIKEEGNPFSYIEALKNNEKKKDVNYDFFKLLQSKDNHFYFIDLGNPHFVCVLNTKNEDPLIVQNIFDTILSSKDVGDTIRYCGEYLQKEYLKTSGINVSFAVVESDKEIYVRTFERGVGETLSCASGSVSSVIAGIKAGLLDSKANIKVFNRGSEKEEKIENSFTLIKYSEEEGVFIEGKGTKIADIITTVSN